MGRFPSSLTWRASTAAFALQRSDFPLGDSLEVFVRREDAERFIELASDMQIEERELEAGGLN